MVNAETGELYAEAGDEADREGRWKELDDAGFDEIIALLDIDHVNDRRLSSATRLPSTRTSRANRP